MYTCMYAAVSHTSHDVCHLHIDAYGVYVFMHICMYVQTCCSVATQLCTHRICACTTRNDHSDVCMYICICACIYVRTRPFVATVHAS